MTFLLWIKGILKSLGWKGILALAVVGVIAFLWMGNRSLKAKIEVMRWELITAEAKIDTVKIPGVYSLPDTVLVTDTLTFTDTLSGETHIVYRDRPVISGDISFDTTKVFGENGSLSVQVRGTFHYPKEFAWQNWMQIIPDWRKPPIMPVTARMPRKWGVGLGLLASSDGAYSVGGIGCFNRTSVALYRRVDQNVWMLGLNYEVF